MGLEKRYLVFRAATDAIVSRHNLLELVEGLEDVDTDSTVESSRLENPEVLLSVAALSEHAGCLDRLLSSILHLL